ncbi:hypothetical protein [Sphingomonas sp. HMP6]|uniref:hypothetical protein n=1 Tax=Sphingomonas sp. HMP6 TaxID=1517551 RepID=UPI00159644FA|nr:hypothetical protein [Sphingomonas sp. HMP6]
MSILLILYEESERCTGRLKVRQLSAKISGAGEVRVSAGLQHLQKLGLVSGSFDNFTASGFVISRKGLLYVEQNFERHEDGENTQWIEKAGAIGFSEAIPQEALRAPNAPGVSPAPYVDQSPVQPIHIHNNFSPHTEQKVEVAAPVIPDSKSATKAGWFGAWGAWVGALVAVATLLWILHEAKVF